MCLNAHQSHSMQQTADDLIYGQELRQPLNLAGGMGPEAPAITEVAGMMQHQLDLACQCVARAQAYRKAYYDCYHIHPGTLLW